jgi:hypothetical protein
MPDGPERAVVRRRLEARRRDASAVKQEVAAAQCAAAEAHDWTAAVLAYVGMEAGLDVVGPDSESSCQRLRACSQFLPDRPWMRERHTYIAKDDLRRVQHVRAGGERHDSGEALAGPGLARHYEGTAMQFRTESGRSIATRPVPMSAMAFVVVDPSPHCAPAVAMVAIKASRRSASRSAMGNGLLVV